MGALAIGRLAVRRAAVEALKGGDLEIGRFRVRALEIEGERRGPAPPEESAGAHQGSGPNDAASANLV